MKNPRAVFWVVEAIAATEEEAKRMATEGTIFDAIEYPGADLYNYHGALPGGDACRSELKRIVDELDEIGIGQEVEVSGGDAVEYLNILRERLRILLGA